MPAGRYEPVPVTARALFAPCEARLAHVPLTVHGTWSERRSLEYADPRTGRAGVGPYVWRTYYDWLGEARGDGALVALLYAEDGHGLAWSRDERRWELARPIRLLCSPDERDDAGLRFYVSLSATSASVGAHVLLRAAPPAAVHVSGGSLTTGIATELFAIEGEPRLTFGALFLSKPDVLFRRNGLWGLHPRLAAALAEPLRGILTRGREGRVTEGGVAERG